MVRYDAAIIGAGGEGLAASIALAEAGLSTVVVERNVSTGGRLSSREFHPGFFASPFTDAIPHVPAQAFHALRLARHGIAMMPLTNIAIAPDYAPQLASKALLGEIREVQDALLARAGAEALELQPRLDFFAPSWRPWPGAGLGEVSLTSWLAARGGGNAEFAAASASFSFDPYLNGSAMHLLAAQRQAVLPAGPVSLAAALEHRARALGVEILCGAEAAEIRRRGGRVAGLLLADGRQLAVRAVVSTLDLRQTCLSFFSWSDLPPGTVQRAKQFRMAASVARLLVALDLPQDAPQMQRAVLHLDPSPQQLSAAWWACREQRIPDDPPLSLFCPSAFDPSAAPPGAAVLTVTATCIPPHPSHGGWNAQLRDNLARQMLTALDRALPGLSARLRGYALIVPPDIEASLACSEGDLTGGEVAPDQFGAFRPWREGPAAPRTPVPGLYLAGGSTAAGIGASCYSGLLAAAALVVDRRAGRLS